MNLAVDIVDGIGGQKDEGSSSGPPRSAVFRGRKVLSSLHLGPLPLISSTRVPRG
jgi:hypothetical protein